MKVPLNDFLAGLADGVLDGQLGLDELGRDSIDAFADTGVLPTVLAWRTVRVELPLRLGVQPKDGADAVSAAFLAPDGTARLALSLRYLESEQGVDDPQPVLRGPGVPTDEEVAP